MVAPDHHPKCCDRECFCEGCFYETGCMRNRISPNENSLVTEVPKEGIHRNTTMGKPMVAPDHHPKGSDRESVCECCVNETGCMLMRLRTNATSLVTEHPKQGKHRKKTKGKPMVATQHHPKGSDMESLCECCVNETGCMRKRIRPNATSLVTEVPKEGIHRNTTDRKSVVSGQRVRLGGDRVLLLFFSW
jgi:hypothetical protein